MAIHVWSGMIGGFGSTPAGIGNIYRQVNLNKKNPSVNRSEFEFVVQSRDVNEGPRPVDLANKSFAHGLVLSDSNEHNQDWNPPIAPKLFASVVSFGRSRVYFDKGRRVCEGVAIERGEQGCAP